MSLFDIRHEYQRSIDRIFDDFSVHSRAQTETPPEEVEGNHHRSVTSVGNQRERYVQPEIQNAITPRVPGEYEFIQHDVKAWASFLDSKRKQ